MHDPFDFNKDGQLDASERFIEYMTYCAVMGEDEDEEDAGDEEYPPRRKY